jgi:hypothetical protein
MDYSILLTLLFFGIWISYFDIKKGKIKNYSLLILALSGIFINIYFTGALFEFPLASFLNIFFGLFLAIMIWLAGLWSAADAKLFTAINFLFPVTFYKYNFGYFPGMAILINSAIPLFLFLFLQIIIKTRLKEKGRVFISRFKLSFILRLLLTISAIFCLTFLISSFLKVRIEYLIWLTIIFLLFWFVEQKLKIKLHYFFIVVILSTVLLSLIFSLPLFTLSSLIFILTFFLLIFLLFVILELSISLFTNSVKIDNLKEGMIPAEMIVQEKGRYVKKPITFLTFLGLLRERARQKPLVGFNPDGLEEEEVEEIWSLYKKRLLGFEDLKISITIPFAPILFFGALLTYFLKGTLAFYF